MSQTERWYAVLADADATEAQWLEAAQNITASTLRERPRPDQGVAMPGLCELNIWAPLQGESLREGKDPSVSALMAERAEKLTTLDLDNTLRLHHLDAACDLTLCLARWDLQAALPVLRRRIEQCRGLTRDKFFGPYAATQFPGSIAQMVMVGVAAGAPEFLDEYVGWVRELRPDRIQFPREAWQVFRPLARYREQPAIRSLAAELFAEDSVWLKSPPVNLGWWQELLSSALIGVPAFREYLKMKLRDDAPFGSVRVNVKKSSIDVRSQAGNMGGAIPAPSDPENPRYDDPLPIRNADFVAWRLGFVEGAPAFEIYWPDRQKDAAIPEMIAFLDLRGNAYGDRTVLNPPRYFANGFGSMHAKFHIPKPDRVADKNAVTEGRAVFSLGDRAAEARLVALANFPQRARWTPTVDGQNSNGAAPAEIEKAQPTKPRVVMGFVWQAEEIKIDGEWQRFFGFVGKHDIAQVPAEQVELLDEPPRDR